MSEKEKPPKIHVLLLGIFRHLHLLPELERLSQRYPLMLLTLTEVQDWYDLFETAQKRYGFIELRKGPISTRLLYNYLHASDALILHKESTEKTVVSSTIFTCLGSGCSILAYDTNTSGSPARLRRYLKGKQG